MFTATTDYGQSCGNRVKGGNFLGRKGDKFDKRFTNDVWSAILAVSFQSVLVGWWLIHSLCLCKEIAYMRHTFTFYNLLWGFSIFHLPGGDYEENQTSVLPSHDNTILTVGISHSSKTCPSFQINEQHQFTFNHL